ncbi:putative ribosome-associated sigma 54 modulation protein [Candidatus Regiella insecticola LSR1]|uniref:Ribosome hibernation promoting factor n=1 Tax=Candidatus Regiella insecticola LSR1 TaxID=663321 RepID=E0WRS6_9ENTR|nr:ribosome hibernation promoting factor [Candidatus Regiella insecticola]EFL92300.1 putative ribosome-associated sigma 54 modulation protein [Candidatus Regiella insecticola LSR1]
MQLNVTGHHHLEITDPLRDFIEKKLSRLERYFDHINQVRVELRVEKTEHIAEATVDVNGGKLHATSEHPKQVHQDMYAAIDCLVDKLACQLKKHKDKLKKR